MRRKEEREMENLWKTVTENVGFIVVIAITAAVLFAVAKLGEMWAGVISSQQMRTKKSTFNTFLSSSDATPATGPIAKEQIKTGTSEKSSL